MPRTYEDVHDELRPLLFSIAYEMLGTVGDSEDIVQEAFLRLQRAAREGTSIESPRAFLTTVTTRLAIDELRSARVRRQSYVGPWLPEPLLTGAEPSPAQAAETADALSISFLVLLETLSPVERAVFLLHEVFDYRYREIAGVVQKSEANCRQILARARKRVDHGKPRFAADRERHRELTMMFLEAFEQGDVDRVIELLAPDVVFTGDGGGKGQGLPQPVYGRDRVARLLKAFASQGRALGGRVVQTTLNGQPGTLNLDAHGDLINVFAFEVIDDQIQAIRSIINPDKLHHLGYRLSDIGRTPSGTKVSRSPASAPDTPMTSHPGSGRSHRVAAANQNQATERIDMHEFGDALIRARTTGDISGALALLADDVVFRSPVVHAPYHGRDRVGPLLSAVVQVFDDFEFIREIGATDAADHALVFRARIGDRQLEGCDFLHTRHDGLIDEFYVMVRPLSGAVALAEAMKRQLSADESQNAV